MKWNFNQLEQGFDYQGIRDGDIEVFDKTRYQSVVRESIQNSLDARLDTTKPVEINFKFFKIDKNSIPSICEIEKRLHCSENWDKANDDDRSLIKTMIDSIEVDEYSCLEIADYNTRGMESKTTFDSFAHSRNVSTKVSGSSAGSKGMGKAAYFALSYLRTLLVSSIHFENQNKLFQGISRISTHPYKDKIYNYKGYYSSGYDPEDSFNNIPEIFSRNLTGTSIFILGLWQQDDRNAVMKKELVNNFWLAILEKELVVSIDNDIINSYNIYETIKALYPEVTESGHYNTNPNPRPYIEAYVGKNCVQKIFTDTIDYLGYVRFIISKNKDYQGRIANFRMSKMLIFKDTAHLYKGYCGIFICDDVQGNEYLKKMENATHTEWKINNWKDPAAYQVMLSYKNFLKKCIEDFVEKEHAGEITISEFDSLLSLMGDRSVEANGSANEIEIKKPVITQKKTEGIADYIPKSFNWIRNKTVKSDNSFIYHIQMNSKKENNNICFEVLVGNDDNSSNSKIDIKSLSSGKFKENKIELNLSRGTNEIALELNDYLKHSIRLKEIEVI
ncbi:hypothetical protein [Chryseobacterium camelliae]|uniref:hypothetical protein n=1 Tax=Chryseobacterium camelliae TaxID=1265445 RepID=UPI002855DA08|nr:hypothetical protein [Chryseobacterium camelliae]MDR6517322.1 hypothetical protein [Chryseobacterium camelliae]